MEPEKRIRQSVNEYYRFRSNYHYYYYKNSVIIINMINSSIDARLLRGPDGDSIVGSVLFCYVMLRAFPGAFL